MAYLLLKARKKIYHGTAALFKRYGKSVSDHPGVYCVIGVLIAALALVGLPLIKIDESLDTVWMEENSRYNSEQATYVENFGDIPRLGVSAFNMENGSSIITLGGLESIKTVIEKLYAFDTPNVLKMEKMINGQKQNMTPDDFCERPMLPKSFLPTDPTDPLSYVRKGAYQSFGYVELAKCIKKTFSHVKLLPEGWGIDKAPCMRISVLDCFKEGDVDYPKNLKMLQDVVSPIGMIMQFQSQSQFINDCMDEFETKVKRDMDILNVPNSAFQASEERYFLQSFTWMIFWSFGYHWRPSMYEFPNAESLMEHVRLSMEMPYTPEYKGIESCILNASSGITPRCCPVWAGTDIGYELFLGKKLYNTKSGQWNGLSSIRNPVVAQPHNNPFWIDEMKKKYDVDDPAVLEELVMSWENNTINYLLGLHKETPGTGFGPGEEFEGVKVNLHTDRSTGDMAAESAQPEIHLLILGGGMMTLYAVVVMGSFSNRCINSNILTMMGGYFVAGASVVGGTGIMGLMGIPTMTLTVLVQLVAFILCLGNIYILMFTFNSRLDTDKPVEDNMVATIEFGGHAVFVISATLFCGFLCGVYVPIPGFRSMCIQMAATCLLTFLLDMFIFVPMMVWNCKRTQDNRMDCFPIKRQSGKPPKKSFLTETKDLFKDYPTIRHSTTKQSLLNKFANSIYGPFILNKVIRIVIIVFFALYIGMSVYTTLQLTKDGLMMSDVAKPGTYQASFAELNEAEYEMFSSYVVTQSKNYPRHQRKNMDIYESLEKNEWLVKYPKPQAWDWLSSGATTLTGYTQVIQNIQNNITMASFLRARNGTEDAFLEDSLFRPDNSESLEFSFLPEVNPLLPLPVKDFKPAIHKWLGSLGTLSLSALSCINPETGFKADCTDENNVLSATRTAVYMRNLTTHENIVSAIKSVRAAVDDVNTPSFKAYVYGFVFGFWGLYINLRQNIALLFGCILVGIVIPITMFHCSLNAAFLIALCMVAGIFEVSASFWMLGANLNGFSIVPLVMTVALVVQYSIFVIHCFIALVNDRKKRAKKTLAETFPAIFSSVFSLFILIVPLAFTSVPFVRTYICLNFLSLAFTSFNIPLLLLPCILSLMGPRNFDSGCEDGENSESDSSPTYHVPPLATSDFNQSNDYTRLTLRSDDDKPAVRLYDVPGDTNGRVTNSPI